jgi:hypothetical protein
VQKLKTMVLFCCGSLWSVFLLAQVDEEHFMLDNFDASTDQGYIDVMGEIRRPDMGIIIPVSVGADGSLLLGNPPVDKVPSQRVKTAVCGQTIYFDGLPERELMCH